LIEPCNHYHLHPGRYDGARTVCLDCLREVSLSVHACAHLPAYAPDEAGRYKRGRALAAADMKTAPMWPASRQSYAGLTRPHDDPDFELDEEKEVRQKKV